MPDLAGKKVIQASAGGGHTVLVLEDGTVRAFGDKEDGQATVTVPDLAGKKAMQAAAGFGHFVLVLEDGTVSLVMVPDGRTVVLNLDDLDGKQVLQLVLDLGYNEFCQTTVPGLAGKKVLQLAPIQVLRLTCSNHEDGISITCTNFVGEVKCVVTLPEDNSISSVPGRIAQELAVPELYLRFVLPDGSQLSSLPISTRVGNLLERAL